jgi:hypothetical protein
VTSTTKFTRELEGHAAAETMTHEKVRPVNKLLDRRAQIGDERRYIALDAVMGPAPSEQVR